MIQIGETLVSDQIFQRRFVCDLNACKGACCVEGDSGAPLEEQEREFLENNIEKIKPFMTKTGIHELEKQGVSVIDIEGDTVTPLVSGKECIYTVFDEDGTAKCGIENAFRAGAITWQKPISCHLYPIRISKVGKLEAVNYSKWNICDPACKLGDHLNVKVYRFLKEPIIRKFGAAFFQELEEVDKILSKT